MPITLLFDTETTGFPKKPFATQPSDVQPFITQIHADLVEHEPDGSAHEVIGTLSTYISGAKFIPKRITELTGVTLEKLEGQPSWKEVRSEFIDMSRKASWTSAHNIRFDSDMVKLEEHRYGFNDEEAFKDIVARCTLTMSRKTNTHVKSHGLGNLYESLFGEKLVGAHTADADSMALTRIYMDLLQKGCWAPK